MILANTPSFIATTGTTQTPTKVDKLIVNYSTMLGQKEGQPQGYINSYLCTEDNVFVYSMEPVEMEFFTDNILKDLHKIYTTYLNALNPKITFTSTL